MGLITVTKNDFFTYFKLDGVDMKYREKEQVWSYTSGPKTISIKVQGIQGWDGGYNSFGKKHLLTTEGGNHTGKFEDKLRSLMTKRSGSGNPNQLRGAKAGNLVQQLRKESPKPTSKSEADQVKFKAEGDVKGKYEASVYTPSALCTVVLLDGLTKTEAAAPFGQAILAADWSKTNLNHLTVMVPGRVYVIDTSMTIDNTQKGIVVHVMHHGGEYHVYHLEKTVA